MLINNISFLTNKIIWTEKETILLFYEYPTFGKSNCDERVMDAAYVLDYSWFQTLSALRPPGCLRPRPSFSYTAPKDLTT